jgi:hypothetical protein
MALSSGRLNGRKGIKPLIVNAMVAVALHLAPAR